jgi:DNA-binding NarL/FixJ family response regulator
MNVMILEDEPLIAMSMQMMVEDQGWAVVGPFATIPEAAGAVERSQVDVALLDCNINGKPSWSVADMLAAKEIPFAFTSGQSARDIDQRFAGRPTFVKPIDEAQVRRFLKKIAAG